jgi:phage terminase large subunit GpA-like protein
MREFAEQEIILPSGPHEGEYFSCTTNPFTGIWFDLVDSGKWRRHAATGPNQSSKTLCCSVTPTLYHLFEMKENVIYGIPDLNMVSDKWEIDLLPVIKKSRYAHLLPKKGSGSRGGSKILSIHFTHGPILRFMVAGGRDKSLAGFTARVLVVTETDAFDVRSEKTREGDKFSQLTRRLRAYGRRGVMYLENTVSVEKGRTWQEFINGTKTELYKPCPHCDQWVKPDREHLQGWQEAATDFEASESLLHCPSCGEAWTEEERYDACSKSVPLARGQSVDAEGNVVGEPPRTDTLSLKWDATDNFIIPIGDAAVQEWNALNGAEKKDPEVAEIELRQSVWAIPPESEVIEEESMTQYSLMKRYTDEVQRRQVPYWADHITVGVDVGKHLLHYVTPAWGQGAKSIVTEYGAIETNIEVIESHTEVKHRAVDIAVYEGLIRLHEILKPGYEDENKDVMYPTLVFIDCNYARAAVMRFVDKMWEEQVKWQTKQDSSVDEMLRCNSRVYWPISGFGETTDSRSAYYAPRSTGPAVKRIGDHSYIGKIEVGGAQKDVLYIDVDHWKLWVRNRLTCEKTEPDSMVFHFTNDRKYGHQRLAKHIMAEVPTVIFVKGKGNVRKWDKKHPNNHLGDALGYAANAAWWAGTRLAADQNDKTDEPPEAKAVTTQEQKPATRAIQKPRSWIPKRR